MCSACKICLEAFVEPPDEVAQSFGIPNPAVAENAIEIMMMTVGGYSLPSR